MKNTLKINEIFLSIQGESTHAGKPCTFVRLTYCNLRCTYCDTEYAFFEGRELSVDEIVDKVRSYKCQTVEITGGEPLIQPSVFPLMQKLCDLGHEVLLETSGSLDISNVDNRVKKIVDFKCPSSGMVDKNFWANVGHLLPHDEVKFVIGSREDFDWAISMVNKYNLGPRVCAVLFSPVFDSIDPAQIADWILSEGHAQQVNNLRFQLQLHKIIWSPLARGV